MRTFSDVIQAVEAAGVDCSNAYWHGHDPDSYGNLLLVIRIDGQDFAVTAVEADDDMLLVHAEPTGPPGLPTYHLPTTSGGLTFEAVAAMTLEEQVALGVIVTIAKPDQSAVEAAVLETPAVSEPPN